MFSTIQTLILSLIPFAKGDCSFDWTTSMLLPGEHLLRKNSLLATLPTLTKEWRVTFEFKPKSYNYNGYAQVLQLTIGGLSTNIGDRTPALWMYKKNGVVKVVIATTLNGKVSVSKVLDKKIPVINQWNAVGISQERQGLDYIFSVVMRGETLWSTKNTKPQEFSNVKVFATSNWYVAQSGYIRGLKIENKIQGINYTMRHFPGFLFKEKTVCVDNVFHVRRFSTTDINGELNKILREHDVAITSRNGRELLLPRQHHRPRCLWERGELLNEICILIKYMTSYSVHISEMYCIMCQVSCGASCSSLGARLCPSGDCSGDCRIHFGMEKQRNAQRSPSKASARNGTFKNGTSVKGEYEITTCLSFRCW